MKVTATTPKFPNSFDPVSWEQEQLELWKKEGTFQVSVEQNKTAGGKHFVFQEGPPTANGHPGLHHVLARTMKDLVCRWKTMQGYVVERKAGWDCHGLPVEREVEKVLGVHTAEEVKRYGVDKFNKLCEESVWKYEEEWEKLTKRMGYWVDLDNRYATLDSNYMESEWALKQLWCRGLLRKGYKVLPYSPKTGCAYSNRDVSEGYKEVTDLTCFVRFCVVGGLEGLKSNSLTSLVAWTSTPWTLPGNVLLAVNKELTYVAVKVRRDDTSSNVSVGPLVDVGYFEDSEVLVVAKARLSELENYLPMGAGSSLEVVQEVQGSDLLGLRYRRPLWSDTLPVSPNLWRVVHADFVNQESGTGVVHVAPLYGDDDFKLCRDLGLDLASCSHVVGPNGLYYHHEENHMVPQELSGKDVTLPETQLAVVELLHRQGDLQRASNLTHEYPFCWRNKNQRLLYYAMDSWFVTMGDDQVRSRMQELNASSSVRFSPEHVKHGRFGEWLKQSGDWCVSRQRTWGCPLPVWECRKELGGCGKHHCFGSRSELRAVLVGKDRDSGLSDLHSTNLECLMLQCPSCKQVSSMRREPYVLDCWFDSGCAPFAQWHYPFAFTEHPNGTNGYPGDHHLPRYNGSAHDPVDFVAEGQDQCRGWFYSLLCVSTTVFDRPAYRHCLSLGLLLDKDGHKMSKSKGNAVDPWEHFNQEGADALRWYLLRMCAPWADRRFDAKLVRLSNQKFFNVLYNVTKWWWKQWEEFRKENFSMSVDITSSNAPDGVLDKWMLSRLSVLVDRCNYHLNSHNFHLVVNVLEEFLSDELSKFYLRLSRSHFKTRVGSENSKFSMRRYACLRTMRTVLVVLSRLVAPLAPFLVDRLHACLLSTMTGHNVLLPGDTELKRQLCTSVHLASWPEKKDFEGFRDPCVEAGVSVLHALTQLGNVLHEQGSRPGRLPLSRLWCSAKNVVDSKFVPSLTDELAEFLAFELNAESAHVLRDHEDLASLLDKAQVPSVAPNMTSLRSRFGNRAPGVARDLRKLLGDEKALPGDNSSNNTCVSLPTNENKSKNQLKREKKEAARRQKQEDKAFSVGLVGQKVDELLELVGVEGSIQMHPSHTGGDVFTLLPSDLVVSYVPSLGCALAEKTYAEKDRDAGSSNLTLNLVLDLSVTPEQASTYLGKEVTHLVQKLRKELEQSELKAGNGLLGNVVLEVVVAVNREAEAACCHNTDTYNGVISEETWQLVMLQTRSVPSRSWLEQNPEQDLLFECERLTLSGVMRLLDVKAFGACPGYKVYVRCTKA